MKRGITMFINYSVIQYERPQYHEFEIFGFNPPENATEKDFETFAWTRLQLVQSEAIIPEFKKWMSHHVNFTSLGYDINQFYDSGFLKPYLRFKNHLGTFEILFDDEAKVKPNIKSGLYIKKGTFGLEDNLYFEFEGNFVITAVNTVPHSEIDEDGNILYEWEEEEYAPLSEMQARHIFRQYEKDNFIIAPMCCHHPELYDFSDSYKILPFDTFDELDDLLNALK